MLVLVLAAGCGCPGRTYPPAATSGPTAHRPRTSPAAVSQPAESTANHPILGMFRGDPARRGQTPFPVPARAPSLRWRLAAGRPIFSSPVLDGAGNVYFGSLDGRLYSVGPDGRLRWRQPLGGRVYATAALIPGGVVVGSDADQLFRLDPRDGRTRWAFALGPCPSGVGPGPESVRCDADSSPLIGPDGSIILGGDALYRLSADGSLRWRAALPGHAFSSPALDAAGNLYVGTQGALLSFDGKGNRRWEHRGLYDFDATPALTPDGAVVAGCGDGLLYAFRAADGQKLWTHATRGPILSSAAIAPDGTILFGSDDGQLRALRPGGSLRWAFAARGPIRSSPVVDPAGRVLFGAEDDHLYAVDQAGNLLWSLELGGDLDSSPALAPDGTIYVGCDDGHLYAVH